MAETNVMYASGTLKKWLEIVEDMPALAQLGPLQLCSTVYYPIALLKMRLEEYSYEDFDAVELSLLRFCSVGIHTPDKLCQWMGLPSQRYVSERLSILTAEGLLNNGQLTSLGRDSLQIGKKKQLYDAEQLFQADGILGLLLPKEYQRRVERLESREQTKKAYPHLMRSDSIAIDSIRSAIQGPGKIRNYKRYRKSILNVNVEQVQDVRFSELRYLRVLLVKLQGIDVPLVFLPHWKEKKGDRTQSSAPLYLPQSLISRLPALTQVAEVVPDACLSSLTEMCNLLHRETAALPLEAVRAYLEEKTAYAIPQCTWQNGRLMVTLDYQQKTNLSPLDLELMAAAGSGTPMPVEMDVKLPSPKGNGEFYQHLTVWPVAGKVPQEAVILAQGWLKKNADRLRRAKRMYSYSELQELLQKDERSE